MRRKDRSVRDGSASLAEELAARGVSFGAPVSIGSRTFDVYVRARSELADDDDLRELAERRTDVVLVECEALLVVVPSEPGGPRFAPSDFDGTIAVLPVGSAV